MPDFTFHCTYPLNYTEGRDAAGRNLGEVQPGDIRDLDAAPDQHWHETTDEDRAAPAAQDAVQAAAPAQEQAAGDGSEASRTEGEPAPDQTHEDEAGEHAGETGQNEPGE